MKEGSMRAWFRITLAVLLVIGTAAPALANSEMHPGGRAFFPLWDVSGPGGGRLTFIILTRLALFGQTAANSDADSFIGPIAEYTDLGNPELWKGDFNYSNNCRPRDTTGTLHEGVNAVHFQYYGKDCLGSSEVVYMSCADIDVFLLTKSEVRPGFGGALGQGDQGALDVHFIDDENLTINRRIEENSLMGNAVISDIGEGWFAAYPAAMAKATYCATCVFDGGNSVGYEPYPMEVFIPWVFPDGHPQGGGALKNLLSLWAPTLLPGDNMDRTGFSTTAFWYDGRERPHRIDRSGHKILEFLGTGSSAFDPLFKETNYTCSHTNTGSKAENDGAPRPDVAAGPASCDPAGAGTFSSDTAHESDNFDVQFSTPIGWWDIVMNSDAQPVPNVDGLTRSGRGLVGVVLASGAGGADGKGAGEAIRLWHKDPCEIGPLGLLNGNAGVYGPPHLRDRLTAIGNIAGGGLGASPSDYIVFFNSFTFSQQRSVCDGFIPRDITDGPFSRPDALPSGSVW
jgi:hypothetical protein